MSSFPTECRDSLPELLPLFFSSLEDSMPSVRQGAASSLATLTHVCSMLYVYNYYVHVPYNNMVVYTTHGILCGLVMLMNSLTCLHRQ